MRVVVTGSEGLIGKPLCQRLATAGWEVVPFDVRRHPVEDIRLTNRLLKATEGATGIVHLAAVSRVVAGQTDPVLCETTNVGALSDLLQSIGQTKSRPWLVFASSREVYGEATELPVKETQPLAPLNTYARSKVEGERLTFSARESGFCTNVVRFSTVYGSTNDHADRLIPAFARVAAEGGVLRIDGDSTTVDATHLGDVVDGLVTLIAMTSAGERLPVLHFASGIGTTIAELADLAQDCATRPVSLRYADARNYDVSRFVGDPARCRELLGWHAKTPLDEGFKALVREFAAQQR